MGLLFLFSGGLQVLAQSNVWEGDVSGDWFDSGNWSLAAVPGDGAEVAIPAGLPLFSAT